MTRAATYRLAAVVSGAFICAVAACARHQARPPDPGVARLTVEVEAESVSSPGSRLQRGRLEVVVRPRRTPPLWKRLDSLTNAELVAYLNSLAYTADTDTSDTQTANAPCVVAGHACPDGDSARILIQPEAGMNQVAHNAIGKYGMVVARVINHDTLGRDERDFGYPAQMKTWWVVDSSSDSLRSRFFVRTYAAKGPAIKIVGRLHPFVRCDHPDAPSWLPARAKFWNCNQSGMDASSHYGVMPRATTGGGMTNSSYFQFVSLRSSPPLRPERRPTVVASAWVSCGSGCCATSPY